MKKRFYAVVSLLLCTLFVITGCSSKATLSTDIGTFSVARVSMLDSYDTLKADSGQKICVVAMRAKDAIDETRYKSYFCADDGSSVATATIAGAEYPCVAVAYQGAPRSPTVEYVLVFKVADSAAGATEMTLTVPNHDPVVFQY